MLKRRLFALFIFRLCPEAGVQVVLEVRPEVDFLERILGRSRRFGWGGAIRPVQFHPFLTFLTLLPARDLIQHWNRFVNLFKDGIFNHLGIDHLLQLELIQRKHADHLHQPRGQYLALRHLERKSGLQEWHAFSDSPFETALSVIARQLRPAANYFRTQFIVPD